MFPTLLILSSLACLTGIAIVTWLHNQHQMDVVVSPSPAPAEPAPLISVIVPARNEARNIRRCLDCLLAQTYPNFELIVLDDRSTDDTPAILRSYAAGEARLKVLPGAELPSGWAGKPHALSQAAQAAGGEWLCFVDADTFPAPHGARLRLCRGTIYRCGSLHDHDRAGSGELLGTRGPAAGFHGAFGRIFPPQGQRSQTQRCHCQRPVHFYPALRLPGGRRACRA